jgi:ankyrin repeat protein
MMGTRGHGTGLRINVGAALLLSLLMTAGAPDAPVADAAERGDVEQVRDLLRRGADVNAAQGDGMSALHWAATMGRADIADVLLYAGADPGSTTRMGAYTALHLASKAGHVEVIDRLLKGRARAEAETSTGVRALHFAAGSGRADAVAALIRHGAAIDARAGSAELTPLMWATASNRIEAMTTLLDAGSDAALTSAVVDYVAISERDRPMRQLRRQLVTAQRLVEAGPQEPAEEAEPEARAERATRAERPTRREGRGQREEPTEGGAKSETEEESSEEGAAAVTEEEPTEEGAESETVEEPAEEGELAEGGFEEGESEETGENAAEDEESSAEDEPADEEENDEAEDEGEETEETPERALSYNDLVGLEGGFTALHYASRDGYVEAAHLLLARGGDINQGTADGTSPLLMATINGNFDLAMSFLEMGADPNQVAEDGAAPLFTALNRRWGPKAAYPQPSAFRQQQTDYLYLMAALLDAGADVNHRTGRHIWYTSFNFDQLRVKFAGATAFWRAAYATDVEAIKFLIEAGADPDIPTRKVPARSFGFGGPSVTPEEDPSGLEPVPTGGPAVWPIHAASGVGYGEGFAANSHSHAPESWLATVEYLVELGADVNARDQNGYSTVHHAAARGDNELILYLVAQGADVSSLSRRGETTVDMANGPRQRVQPFPQTIALLEGLGAKNNHNCQSC